MKVALIDGGVNINKDTKKYVVKFLELRNIKKGFIQQKTAISEFSHGTICASIIRKNTCTAEIYSLKILDSNGLTASSKRLGVAFEWCLENDIDIINLSLGTVNSKDFFYIRRLVYRLIRKGIILVAAINNELTYTMPASMPEVLGVCTKSSLHEFMYVKDPLIGIDVFAPSIHKVRSNSNIIKTPVSNSFAAPGVTGKLCEVLSLNYKDECDDPLIHILSEKVIDVSEKEFIYSLVEFELSEVSVYNSRYFKKVPLIATNIPRKDLLEMNKLFFMDNIFSIFIKVNVTYNESKIYNIINKVCGRLDCDIAILYNTDVTLMHDELFIGTNSPGYKLKINNRLDKQYKCLKSMYNKILELLE